MADNKEAGMTLIVKTVTRLTVGLILIYGIYICLAGHTGPGGGFAGGVIIALSFVHLMLAYGKDAVLKKLDERRGLALAGSAAIGLLAAILYIRLNDKSTASVIALSDLFSAVLFAAALFVIFLALVLLTGEDSEK